MSSHEVLKNSSCLNWQGRADVLPGWNLPPEGANKQGQPTLG